MQLKINELDKIANLWNKTKDKKYKVLWYQKLKEWSNGRAGALDDDISVKRRSINKDTSRIR